MVGEHRVETVFQGVVEHLLVPFDVRGRIWKIIYPLGEPRWGTYSNTNEIHWSKRHH